MKAGLEPQSVSPLCPLLPQFFSEVSWSPQGAPGPPQLHCKKMPSSNLLLPGYRGPQKQADFHQNETGISRS